MKNNRRLAFSLRGGRLDGRWFRQYGDARRVCSSIAGRKKQLRLVKDQVADAYVFGYPLVASNISRERATGGDGARPGQSPVNTLRHGTALPPVGVVGRPSLDTVDSAAWIDVASGPVVVSLPNAMRGPLLRRPRLRHVDQRAVFQRRHHALSESDQSWRSCRRASPAPCLTARRAWRRPPGTCGCPSGCVSSGRETSAKHANCKRR